MNETSSEFQFLLHECLRMKLIDYVYCMNFGVDSLIDSSCFGVLWIVNCWIDMVGHDEIEIMYIVTEL